MLVCIATKADKERAHGRTTEKDHRSPGGTARKTLRSTQDMRMAVTGLRIHRTPSECNVSILLKC